MNPLQKLYSSVRARFQPIVNVAEANKEITSKLLEAARSPLADVIKDLDSNLNGLTDEEAAERLKKYGYNQILHERSPAWYVLLLKNFTNPFSILLLALALVSFFLGDTDAVIIITVMVLLSVIMRFVQEYRANNAAEQLKSLVSTKATVLRRPNENSEPRKLEVDIRNVVIGDIVHLSAGDMLPGDVRLVSAKDLFVSQAALTGEPMPVEKDESFAPKTTDSVVEMPNMCFMGTDVLNGSALAAIVGIGNKSYFGSMAKSIIGYRPLTSFDIGVNKVSWLLIQFILVMTPIVFLINGFTKGNWFEAFLFSLSVAVGLTPEMLPMIVTANLAKGAVNMSRSKVVVKKLNAIQNFGAMNILCTDKTGTLTQNKIILEKYLNIDNEEDPKVLQYGYLNSYYQTGLKNLLDIAVLDHSEIHTQLHLDTQFRKIDEIPFDFSRRRMSVIVEKDPSTHILVCKGAVEEIVSICSSVEMGGSTVPFTDEIRKQITTLNNELNEDGLRVLAIAYKEVPNGTKKVYTTKDENNLILIGFLAFLDPPKSTAQEALKILGQYNVQVKILTGDNELVTRKICKWVNLDIEGVLNGPDIDALNDLELQKVVDDTTVFAKLSPLQKSRIIAALRSNGHTVGYLGDGINDAPALREADIGISVDTAVDIAKESADIIMLEKSLLFLGQGVIEGRRTFGNIIKYIKMAASSNFGNVFSVLGASALLPFLPMQSIQLLFQNLLYDLSQTAIPFDSVDKEFLVKPRKWDAGGIARFMVFIGPISSIFDYTTFALMWFVFGANSPASQSLFQSGWFVEGLLSQTLIVHMIRTQKIPFIQSMASWQLMLTTFVIMAIGIYTPYSFIGASLGLSPLPLKYFGWLFVTLLCYCTLTQIVKNWYIRKYHSWL